MAFVLAFWRLSADVGATGQFAISSGLFSHWQVWLAVAALLEFLAIVLNRYGNAEPSLPEAVEESKSSLL